MSKLLTRLLLLTLSAFSISVYSDFNENPRPEHVPPKTESQKVYLCKDTSSYTNFTNGSFVGDDSCIKITKENFTTGNNGSVAVQNCFYSDNYSNRGISCTYLLTWMNSDDPNKPPFEDTKSITVAGVSTALYQRNENVLVCPPDSYPDYMNGPKLIVSTDPNSGKACFPKFKPCPLGFISHAITVGGVEQCVPFTCPDKGTLKSNIKNFSNVLPVNGEGTYCDGMCSYSVSQGAISYQGQKFATGISNGAMCGQGPGDKNKFTPLADEDSCVEHTLSSGAIFQDCAEGIDDPVDEQPDPTPPIEDSLVDEDVVVDPFTGIDCTTVDDKMTCVGKNITDAITEQTKKQAKLDAEKHNKLAKQQKEITDYVESQAVKREQRRALDAAATIESIDNVARTVNSVLGEGSGGNGQGNQAILDALAGIGEGLGETDTETDGTPSEGIESFYEPEYPNGFSDVWTKNKDLLYSSAPFEFVEQFSNIPLSGAQAPEWEFCFNLGEKMNYGCDSITLDSRLFGFLYSIMMITAAFASRQIIFGG